VFAFLEGAVGDLAQQARMMIEGSDMAPVDLIRMGVEMVRAEGCQARKHRVELDLRGEEGVEGLGIVSGVAGRGVGSLSALHRLRVTIIALMD